MQNIEKSYSHSITFLKIIRHSQKINFVAMKKNCLTMLCMLFSIIAFSQISTVKVSGGSVITKLGMGISVNSTSTLTRDFVIINDEKCPLQLDNSVGINTTYSSNYRFASTGGIIPIEPIAAYEIHHVLYNVFGEHIKTLSNTEVSDINSATQLSKTGRWYADENQVSEYLICVSYVASVRTMQGHIWRYDPELIKQELTKIQIDYDEGYKPKSDANDK